MNYGEVRLKKESVDMRKLGRSDLNAELLDIEELAIALEDERNLYRDLLLACAEYLPDINPHGVDKRALEEALGKEARR